MKPVLVTMFLVLTLGLYASPADPAIQIDVDRENGTASVFVREVSLSRVIDAAELRSGIFVDGPVPEMTVSMMIRDVELTRLVEVIIREAGLRARRAGTKVILEASTERTVSIDVVDGDARSIIELLARQCGVRNVMIDPDVETKATLLFRSVPCSTAFRVALSTLDLDAEMMPNSVLVARGRR